MKLEDIRDNYQYYSQKISDIIRQLGFAGIALIWIFKNVDGNKQFIPSALMLPTLLIIISLGLDLFHYISGTLIWGIYNRIKELRDIKEDDEFLAPNYINWITLFFFWTKIIVMVVAFIFILIFLYYKIV
jgi:hypothetical protein